MTKETKININDIIQYKWTSSPYSTIYTGIVTDMTTDTTKQKSIITLKQLDIANAINFTLDLDEIIIISVLSVRSNLFDGAYKQLERDLDLDFVSASTFFLTKQLDPENKPKF